MIYKGHFQPKLFFYSVLGGTSCTEVSHRYLVELLFSKQDSIAERVFCTSTNGMRLRDRDAGV